RVVQQDDQATRQVAADEVGNPLGSEVLPVLSPGGPVDGLEPSLEAGSVGCGREAAVWRSLVGRRDAGRLDDRLDRLPEVLRGIGKLVVMCVVKAVRLDVVPALSDLLR